MTMVQTPNLILDPTYGIYIVVGSFVSSRIYPLSIIDGLNESTQRSRHPHCGTDRQRLLRHEYTSNGEGRRKPRTYSQVVALSHTSSSWFVPSMARRRSTLSLLLLENELVLSSSINAMIHGMWYQPWTGNANQVYQEGMDELEQQLDTAIKALIFGGGCILVRDFFPTYTIKERPVTSPVYYKLCDS
jgi:hypothetical protein